VSIKAEGWTTNITEQTCTIIIITATILTPSMVLLLTDHMDLTALMARLHRRLHLLAMGTDMALQASLGASSAREVTIMDIMA
jgi:hypothetical protein